MDLRSLELFAGAGGGCLASQHLLGFQTVAYVEREPYCQRVLQARIRDGVFHDAPIWDDVRTFPAHQFRGKVDVVCGGFPCQPFSVAGRGLAADDDRNCWPETLDVIRCIRPRYAFLENVPGLLAESHGYFGTVLRELAEAGYDAEWGVLSAADVGAPHQRKRVWILATDTDSRKLRNQPEPQRGRISSAVPKLDGVPRHVPDSDGSRRHPVGPQHATAQCAGERCRWWDKDPAEWAAKSRVGILVDGVAAWLDLTRTNETRGDE